jgi:hypothetical protein
VHVIMDEIFMNGILVESNRKRAVPQMTWSPTSHWKSIKAPLLWNTWYDVHLRRFTLFPKEINPISCAKRKTTASPALIFRIKKIWIKLKPRLFLAKWIVWYLTAVDPGTILINKVIFIDFIASREG